MPNPLIHFSAPITIQAAATGDKPGPRRFDMTAYTGGAMQLKGWQYPVVVDVTGIQGIDKSRPVLHAHDPAQRVGHTDKITVAEGQLSASGVISGAGDVAKQICAEADTGFPWQASIGARPLKTEFVPEGKTAQANGQSFNGPLTIARRTSLGEISFVALGADDNTSARIAATAAESNTMEFEQWLEAQGIAAAGLTDAGKATLQAAFDAEQDKPAKGKKKAKKIEAAQEDEPADEPDPIHARREAEATETERCDRIREICATANPQIEIKADGKSRKVSLQAHAIREGWDVTKVELEAIRAARPTGGPYINTGAGNEMSEAAITAACARSAGISEKVAFAGLDDKTKEIAASKKLRGIGLHQAMFIVAQSAGIHVTPGRVDDAFLRAMLHHDQQTAIRAADGGGFSTMSLSGITENIMNKGMLEAYAAVPSVVSDIAYETDTNDFKTYKRYRLTGSGTMQNVGPSGEIKNMTLQDETYSNTVSTKGCIIPISRNILINDDMGALVQMPQVIGRQGAIAREKALFTALLANTGSFFGTGNTNYISGATSALSITSLTVAEQKGMEQVDANSDPVMVMLDRILVPPALKVTAENLFKADLLIASGLSSTSTRTVEPSKNPHAGKYTPIVSPFLGTVAGLTGSSQTGWYLLGNPAAGMAVLQVGYLRGQRTPIIERGEVDFNTLGMAMRGYYDFGVALLDYRTGVFSAGA